MGDVELLRFLEGPGIPLDAYAASSAYVLRIVFESADGLRAFKRRADLAPTILKRIRQLTAAPYDPVVIGAHLYALGLTGAERESRSAAALVLTNGTLRGDPLVGQFAGWMGARLIHDDRSAEPERTLNREELERIGDVLRGEEEPK